MSRVFSIFFLLVFSCSLGLYAGDLGHSVHFGSRPGFELALRPGRLSWQSPPTGQMKPYNAMIVRGQFQGSPADFEKIRFGLALPDQGEGKWVLIQQNRPHVSVFSSHSGLFSVRLDLASSTQSPMRLHLRADDMTQPAMFSVFAVEAFSKSDSESGYGTVIQWPSRIILHQVSGPAFLHLDSAEAVAHLWREHAGLRKFKYMAYHFLIDGGGQVHSGRPLTQASPAALGRHTGAIAIGFLGDFSENRSLPPEMIQAFRVLAHNLSRQYRLEPQQILGHGDLDEDGCGFKAGWVFQR